MKKPVLLCSLGLAIALLAPAGSAQSGAEARGVIETEALTDKARQLCDEEFVALTGRDGPRHPRRSGGVAHQAAPTRSRRTWARRELRLGKYRDAAEHLSWYLREAPGGAGAAARADIAEGSAGEGRSDHDHHGAGRRGGEGDDTVGRTPLALPVFLEPDSACSARCSMGTSRGRSRSSRQRATRAGSRCNWSGDAEAPAAVACHRGGATGGER